MVWPSCYLGVLRFPLKTHFLPLHSRLLRKHLRDFDVIHIHDDVDLTFSFITRKAKRPKIFTCHSLPYWRKYYRLNPLARRLLKTSANCYHVLSNRDKRFLMDIGFPEEKIAIIPHGVDTKVFSPKNSKSKKDYIRIGFLGSRSRLVASPQLATSMPRKT